MDMRVSLFGKLAKLQGKLDLLLAQVGREESRRTLHVDFILAVAVSCINILYKSTYHLILLVFVDK